MIAKAIFVGLLMYLAVCAAYRCYKKHFYAAIVYLALYVVVLLFLSQDEYCTLLNKRASDVLEKIVDGFDTVILFLSASYALITMIMMSLVSFAQDRYRKSGFLLMYFLFFIVKLGFVLYNNASLLLVGSISMFGLLFNPVMGFVAYNDWKYHYHLVPYLAEFKESGSFGGCLLIASCGLSLISMVYVLIP